MGVGRRQASVLRPAGTLHVYDCDGPEQTFDTVQCCHCQRHWVYVPGSGRKRGFCLKCNKLTCGEPACDACVPVEQRLENIEAGRDPLAERPLLIPVTRSISGV